MKALGRSSAPSCLARLVCPRKLDAATFANVLTSHNDNFRTGQNTNEIILNPQNVNTNTFSKLWTYSSMVMYTRSHFAFPGVAIPGKGIHNVLYVATEHNSVYALEADSNKWFTNGVIWKANLGPSAITPTNSFGTVTTIVSYGYIPE